MKKPILSRIRSLSIFLLACAMLLNACGAMPPSSDSSAPSGQAWVEYPYEGDILPMAPVTLVVYAASDEGVGQIAIQVNGEALSAPPPHPLTADGSPRLVRVDLSWDPPAEGEYVVEAAAGGGSGRTRFCIVTCSPVSGTSTPAANETETPTPFIENTGTPTPAQTTTAVPIITSTPTTKAIIPTLTFTELPPPPPPSDTSGPSINVVSVFWYPEGCSLFGTADITDPSGVTWAEFHFNLNDSGWAWIKMNQSGTTWTSQVGVDTAGLPGTLVYKVRTLDSLNNESWSGESFKNFAYCGD